MASTYVSSAKRLLPTYVSSAKRLLPPSLLPSLRLPPPRLPPPRRTFYHFHGDPRQVIRVPSPLSVARLTKMDYKINGMMELRDITPEERIKHLHLRKRRSELIRAAGHEVQEVDFPVLQVSEFMAWTEFPPEVKSILAGRLEGAGLLQNQILSRGMMSLLLEEEEILADITSHPALSPHTDYIQRWLNSIAIGLPDCKEKQSCAALYLSVTHPYCGSSAS